VTSPAAQQTPRREHATTGKGTGAGAAEVQMKWQNLPRHMS
jgi:hypothetical protein